MNGDADDAADDDDDAGGVSQRVQRAGKNSLIEFSGAIQIAYKDIEPLDCIHLGHHQLLCVVVHVP